VWKWFVGVFIVLALACGGSGYYLKTSGKFDEIMSSMRPDMKARSVRLTQAVQGDLVRTISAPGQIEPKTNVEISAQVSARIVALPFEENDRVKEGDVVARLDARDLAALMDSARSQLKSEEARLQGARAAFENATAERNRRVRLQASNDISQSELEQFETEYRRSESSLRQAEQSIEIAKANILRAEKDLDNTTITAPFDGVITRLDAEVGELVVVGTLNNPGSVFMEIADLSVMLVKARVDESNIARVVEGQKARVFVNAYSEQVLVGTVDHVGLKRQVDKDGTAYFETDVLLELPEGLLLRSGLTANADIEVETFRDIIKVPSQAVLDRPLEDLPASVTDGSPYIDRNKKFARVIYKMVDGKAQAVPVDVGASDLTTTVVVGGLKPGEQIITGPYKALIALKHDQKVVEEGKDGKPTDAKKIEAAAKDAEKPATPGT